MKKISVIYTIYGNFDVKRLHLALSSALEQDYPEKEIIVVENNPKKTFKNFSKNIRHIFLKGPKKGFSKIRNIGIKKAKNTDKEIFRSYLYDRGEEVLTLAENQFPFETMMIVKKLTELIKNGEINNKISGGELLTLFRTVGLNIRIDTKIKIEDHGKYVSFGEKLKRYKEDYEKD